MFALVKHRYIFIYLLINLLFLALYKAAFSYQLSFKSVSCVYRNGSISASEIFAPVDDVVNAMQISIVETVASTVKFVLVLQLH